MLVAKFTSKRPEGSGTRTYEDFYRLMGDFPERLGIMAKLYVNNTSTFITEAVGNVFRRDTKKPEFTRLDVMSFEWGIETNQIKRVEFALPPVGDGADGSEIIMTFTENYYNAQDIILIEGSRQQVYILTNAVNVGGNNWEHRTRLIDNTYESLLDASSCQPRMTTRFQSNAVPEMSEHGYTKVQSSVETHKNWITTHRVDTDQSSLYSAMEDNFVEMSNVKDGKKSDVAYYKMNKAQKDLFDTFMFVRSNGAMFNKTNIDKNGKPTISDIAGQRPIYIGDGMIPQIERFAHKFNYSIMTDKLFLKVLEQMTLRSENPTGNNYMFVCNEAMWNQVQAAMRDYLQRWNPCASLIWNQNKGEYDHVGTTFQSFEANGNVITFKVDRALTREFGAKGYGVFIDLTHDLSTGKAAVQAFTLKNGDMINSEYLGVGGRSGLASGYISSTVAGSKYVILGYSGIGVFAPYRSAIMFEN